MNASINGAGIALDEFDRLKDDIEKDLDPWRLKVEDEFRRLGHEVEYPLALLGKSAPSGAPLPLESCFGFYIVSGSDRIGSWDHEVDVGRDILNALASTDELVAYETLEQTCLEMVCLRL